MKKSILLIAILLGLCQSKAYCQDESTTTTTTTTTVTTDKQEVKHDDDHFKRWYVGGIVLATYTDIKINHIDHGTTTTSAVLGWGSGGLLGVDISRHVDVELEVMYSSLAQQFKNTYNTDDRLEVKYINIPLLLGLNTDVTKPVNFNITAGPQVGINVGSSVKHVESEQIDTINAVLSVKKGDVGVAFGAGVDFRIAECVKLSVGYRGVRGIVDVSDNSQNITTKDYYILDRSHVNTNSGYAALSILF